MVLLLTVNCVLLQGWINGQRTQWLSRSAVGEPCSKGIQQIFGKDLQWKTGFSKCISAWLCHITHVGLHIFTSFCDSTVQDSHFAKIIVLLSRILNSTTLCCRILSTLNENVSLHIHNPVQPSSCRSTVLVDGGSPGSGLGSAALIHRPLKLNSGPQSQFHCLF